MLYAKIFLLLEKQNPFYEQQNIFHKYRLDFELGKEYYDFSFYLFNEATTQLPYILSALHMMLTQNGLGKDRKTYKNFNIYINDNNCLQNGDIKIPKNFVKTFQIDKICPDVKLKFITPLRMKKDNRFIRNDKIELKDLVNSIYQRQMKLLNKEYRKFPYEINGEIIDKKLKYKELTRHSNRQKTTMNLGGIMGSIEIKNLNEESFNVLKLGELIGLGKSTVFGLGKIKVDKK